MGGIILGALAGVALVAAFPVLVGVGVVGTGLLGAAAIGLGTVSMVTGAAALVGKIGRYLGGKFGSGGGGGGGGPPCSTIASGSPKTIVEGKALARVTDPTTHNRAPLKTGAQKVLEQGKLVSRVDESATCGASKVLSGASKTFVGGPSADSGLPMQAEEPSTTDWLIDALDTVSMVTGIAQIPLMVVGAIRTGVRVALGKVTEEVAVTAAAPAAARAGFRETAARAVASGATAGERASAAVATVRAAASSTASAAKTVVSDIARGAAVPVKWAAQKAGAGVSLAAEKVAATSVGKSLTSLEASANIWYAGSTRAQAVMAGTRAGGKEVITAASMYGAQTYGGEWATEELTTRAGMDPELADIVVQSTMFAGPVAWGIKTGPSPRSRQFDQAKEHWDGLGNAMKDANTPFSSGKWSDAIFGRDPAPGTPGGPPLALRQTTPDPLVRDIGTVPRPVVDAPTARAPEPQGGRNADGAPVPRAETAGPSSPAYIEGTLGGRSTSEVTPRTQGSPPRVYDATSGAGTPLKIHDETFKDSYGYSYERLRVEGAPPGQGELYYSVHRNADGSVASVGLDNLQGVKSGQGPSGAGAALKNAFLENVAGDAPVHSFMNQSNGDAANNLFRSNSNPSIDELAAAVPAFRHPGYDYKLSFQDGLAVVEMRRNPNGETRLANPEVFDSPSFKEFLHENNLPLAPRREAPPAPKAIETELSGHGEVFGSGKQATTTGRSGESHGGADCATCGTPAPNPNSIPGGNASTLGPSQSGAKSAWTPRNAAEVAARKQAAADDFDFTGTPKGKGAESGSRYISDQDIRTSVGDRLDMPTPENFRRAQAQHLSKLVNEAEMEAYMRARGRMPEEGRASLQMAEHGDGGGPSYVNPSVNPANRDGNTFFHLRDGWTEVQIHGSDLQTMTINTPEGKRNVTHAELAGLLKQHGLPDGPIMLTSCEGAAPFTTFGLNSPSSAQMLADASGRPVLSSHQVITDVIPKTGSLTDVSKAPTLAQPERSTSSAYDPTPRDPSVPVERGARWEAFYPKSDPYAPPPGMTRGESRKQLLEDLIADRERGPQAVRRADAELGDMDFTKPGNGVEASEVPYDASMFGHETQLGFFDGLAKKFGRGKPEAAGPSATTPDVVRSPEATPSTPSRVAPDGMPPEPTTPLAYIPSTKGGLEAVPPHIFAGGFHGTSYSAADVPGLLANGLPKRGTDWRLREHSEDMGNSAYRGTTASAADASLWADQGGVVFDIQGVPGWEVNAALEGRVQRGAGFGGNLMTGEAEVAIPSDVPGRFIKRWGEVELSSSGRKFVKTWHENPGFDPSVPWKHGEVPMKPSAPASIETTLGGGTGSSTGKKVVTDAGSAGGGSGGADCATCAAAAPANAGKAGTLGDPGMSFSQTYTGPAPSPMKQIPVEPTFTPAPKKELPPERAAQLNEMLERAKVAKPEVDAIADEIAAATGGTVAKAPIKSFARAAEKTINDYDGDPSRLKDLVRNTVIVDEANFDKAVQMLADRGAKVKLVDAATDPLGYSGANTTLPTSTGLMAEVQVNTPAMIYAKEKEEMARILLGDPMYRSLSSKLGVEGGKGHTYYEEWRSAPPDAPLRSQLEVESRGYYDYVRSTFSGSSAGGARMPLPVGAPLPMTPQKFDIFRLPKPPGGP